MKRAAELIRKYNKPDGRMLVQAELIHTNFVRDKEMFIEKAPVFNNPFAENFQTAITFAEGLPLDYEIRAWGGLCTDILKKEMLVAGKAFQELMFYIKMAFPNGKTILRVFGQNKFEKARNLQADMMTLIEQAHLKTEDPEYKNKLITAGYTQAKIDNLETLHNSLHQKNSEQAEAFSSRIMKTKERVEALNLVWSFIVKVSNASKLIFADNPTKTQIYLLYREGRYRKKKKSKGEE